VNPVAAQTGGSDPNLPAWEQGIINARDLRFKNFPKIRYVVPGLIPEGATLFAGRPKIGKSWAVLQICIAKAGGERALGWISHGACESGDVLYLSLEDGERRLQRRLEKMEAIFGNACPQRLEIKTKWRRFDQGGLDDIRDWAQARPNPVLVVVDTLAKARPRPKGKQDGYQLDYDALTGLQGLAQELRIAALVTHHDRKAEAEDTFDTVSGTLGLTGAVDTILILTRKKGVGCTLHIRGRDIENERELAMTFDRATCEWRVDGEAAEIHRSRERNAVLGVFQTAAGQLTVAEIMAGLNRDDRPAVDQILSRMVARGEIRRVKRGKYEKVK